MVIVAVPRPVEERPARGSVEKQVVSAVDIHCQCRAALAITAAAPGEIGIAVGGIDSPRGRSGAHCARALHVGRFSLQEAGEDVARAVQVVAVEPVVLGARADKPGCLGGFDENAAAGGDDLDGPAVEVVVGGPEPEVLNIG